MAAAVRRAVPAAVDRRHLILRSSGAFDFSNLWGEEGDWEVYEEWNPPLQQHPGDRLIKIPVEIKTTTRVDPQTGVTVYVEQKASAWQYLLLRGKRLYPLGAGPRFALQKKNVYVLRKPLWPSACTTALEAGGGFRP